MCLGVVTILLLNAKDVFRVCDGALLDRPCMVCFLVVGKGPSVLL